MSFGREAGCSPSSLLTSVVIHSLQHSDAVRRLTNLPRKLHHGASRFIYFLPIRVGMAQESATNHSVEQAECTNCNGDEHRVDNKSTPDDPDKVGLLYEVVCESCGETGTIAIGRNGVASTDAITYENASWNESDEDEGDTDG